MKYLAIDPIEYDRRYEPGEPLDLDPKSDTARQLLDVGAIKPDPNSTREKQGQSGAGPADSRRAALFTALTDIQAAGGDKPTVKALKAASGVRDVLAAERDEIWASLQPGD